MKKHTKKMIAPIVISVLLCIWYIGFLVFTLCLEEVSRAEKVGAAIVTVLVTGAAVAVLVERIKEIRKGEEDDLSKY